MAEQREQREHREPRGGFNKKRRGKRRKVCNFCVDKVKHIDYKDIGRLGRYVSERGKILPRRITGNCAAHQRAVTVAIKNSRIVALMPYTTEV
ncbi:30S ribosomal protein S18 [Tumebacillus permanentifrigoris]|jgi:small subunit ribosomal protein S18|uniref:Small ribosomal subunit protein bS18 n=1 Tax=Tumebacillus permanentifrigoris TaxID=378543 RepID=A0A316DBH1_9BACL|nr:30S ribosomal protein S18 [Tumebacillus permanentifrigoris]PWK13374.1 SSU ribosomal protein S18P [Tumebacillus permanentifrigoris]